MVARVASRGATAVGRRNDIPRRRALMRGVTRARAPWSAARVEWTARNSLTRCVAASGRRGRRARAWDGMMRPRASREESNRAETRGGGKDGRASAPEDVSEAFTSVVTSEAKRVIRSGTDVDALRARADVARKALAKAELAYAAAVLARERSADSMDEVDDFGCEYGYISSLRGCYIDVSRNEVPRGFISTGTENFARELREMVAFFDPEIDECDLRCKMPSALRAKLESLRLDAEAIWDRERARPEVPAPWILKGPYLVLCVMLDKLFDETKPIQRFWFLETVARMPYFSYTSMLTFYEILGWWRQSSELRKVHFAEEWNEYHHLLIHESLGGDQSWRDRFLGQHAALVYYIVLVLLWLVSPALAYNFSELIEAHAVDTYAQFVDQNAELLKSMPAPRIAVEYYEGADLYLFDEFQTEREPKSRRPRIKNLYDVFCNIRDDEAEHVSTMNACQREDKAVASPNAVNAKTAAISALITAQYVFQRFAESSVVEDLMVDDIDVFTDDASAGVLDAIIRAVESLFL